MSPYQMPTKEEMLSQIYEKIADKTLSFGCKVEFDDGNNRRICDADMLRMSTSEKNAGMKDRMEYLLCYFTASGTYKDIYTDKNIRKIKGHKITLSRVLSALGYDYFFDNIILKKTDRDDDGQIIDTDRICERKLLNDDGSDAILDGQSEETIQTLYNLICK